MGSYEESFRELPDGGDFPRAIGGTPAQAMVIALPMASKPSSLSLPDLVLAPTPPFLLGGPIPPSPPMPTSIRQSVVFAAKPAAGGKTRLTFTQHGVPNNQFRGISSGWRMYYWNPMKTALER